MILTPKVGITLNPADEDKIVVEKGKGDIATITLYEDKFPFLSFSTEDIEATENIIIIPVRNTSANIIQIGTGTILGEIEEVEEEETEDAGTEEEE